MKNRMGAKSGMTKKTFPFRQRSIGIYRLKRHNFPKSCAKSPENTQSISAVILLAFEKILLFWDAKQF